MPWMRIELRASANAIGIPGILYDHNNAVIDTASDLGAYVEYLSLPFGTFSWWNSCTAAYESYSYIAPGFWVGANFNIFPGMGIEVQPLSACTLPLKFGQGYTKHLICNDGSDDFYCEWLGQEEFDQLEG